MAGTACKKGGWNDVSYPSTEAQMGQQSCAGRYSNNARQDIESGKRPRCWFKPRR